MHHTATANSDPDPAATVRAIYRYHAIDRGWGDIGYQFLVDEAGRIYEGRHTDDDAATPMAFDASGRGVVGACGGSRGRNAAGGHRRTGALLDRCHAQWHHSNPDLDDLGRPVGVGYLTMR